MTTMTLPLPQGKKVRLDPDVAEAFASKALNLHEKGYVIFYRGKKSFPLHKAIAPHLTKVGFKDGDSLNLTRDNLIPWEPTPRVRVDSGILQVPAGFRVVGHKMSAANKRLDVVLGVFPSLGEARTARDTSEGILFTEYVPPPPKTKRDTKRDNIGEHPQDIPGATWLPLGHLRWALLDNEDATALVDVSLFVNEKGYVVHSGGQKLHKALSLHGDQRVTFKDGNSLNLRRDNIIPYRPDAVTKAKVEAGIFSTPAGFKVVGHKKTDSGKTLGMSLGTFPSLDAARSIRDSHPEVTFKGIAKSSKSVSK